MNRPEQGRTDRLQIAFLSAFDPRDPQLSSGGNHQIYRALQRHVGDVQVLDTGWGPVRAVHAFCQRLPLAINMRLTWRLHLLLAPLIARGIRRQLRAGRYDVLFCTYSFQSLAGLRVPPDLLTVYTSDATPTLYRRSEVGRAFGSYLRLSRPLDPLITRAETAVFRRADLLLWPSDWLKSGADALYGLTEAQSLSVPWGANIEDPGTAAAPPSLSRDGPVQLLLVGRNWAAKGGPLTLATLRDLRARGIDARLTVVGCTPPPEVNDPAVTVYPRLNKTRPDELRRFQELFAQAHFFVMPSMESYGFAFCEASAHGLPALCLRAGGIPVRNGINGHAFDLNATAADFADHIQSLMRTPDAYARLRHSTRREYEERLNWDAWAARVACLIAAQVAQKRRSGGPSARSREERQIPSAT